MQFSAGKTLVLELTWIPLDTSHPSKHRHRPKIPSHVKSAKMQKRDCSRMTQRTWQDPKVGLQILQILIRSSICANKSIVRTPWIRLSSVWTQDLCVCSVKSKGHLQQIILVQRVHCEVSGGICCTTCNTQDSKDSLPTSWCQGPHDSPEQDLHRSKPSLIQC